MAKTLHNSDVSGARTNVPDIKVVGNGDMFRLLCKASSQNEGWMKSTKAMEVVGGCVVQVTTHQRNHDGTNSVAEALTYVPGVKIADDENNGRKLVPLG
jgi:outer membrane receptor for Fe3+-dicitrate